MSCFRFRMITGRRAVMYSLLIACFAAACSRNPDAIIASGKKYLAEEKYNEAIIEFKNAANTNPQMAEAHYQLGVTYILVGAFREAAESLARAVSINPNHVAAQLKYGNLLLLQQKF